MNDHQTTNNANQLAKRVGITLRRIRQEKGLSLQELSTITEVSKLTLGNIERGDANPSLSVIWKIANGLSIPISALLTESNEIIISRNNEGNQIISANGACKLEPIFDSSAYGSMEIHRATLKPNSSYSPGPHQQGVVEYVTVMNGEVIIKIEEDSYHLYEYDSIKFNGDLNHAYVNPVSSTTVLHFVMRYAR